MSSVPQRPRTPFFSFDSETGTRRPRWFVAIAAVLALLIATAGVLVGVSAASAHTPKAWADCYKVYVDMRSYNTHGDNSITVTVGNQVVADVADFGHEYIESFSITDPTVGTPWIVEVTAWDDTDGNPNQGYSRVFSGTSGTCAAPSIDLKASVCDAVDGTTRLTATFSSLHSGQTYSAQLFKNGGPAGAAFTPSTSAPTVWEGMQAGVTYQLTVRSTTTSLEKSVETFAVACPQVSDLQVAVTECTSPATPNASVAVTASSLVPNRTYTAQVMIGTAPYGAPVAVVPGGGTSVTFSVPVPPSTGGMTVVLTDDDADPAIAKTSATFSTKACPTQPTPPVVSADECKVEGGTLEIVVTLGNLTVNRSYLVLIDGEQVGTRIVAAGSSQGGLVFPVTAGDHVVTIVDEALPSITAASGTITVKACPTRPVVAIDPTECSVPGGAGTITVTSLTGLSAGRSYTVTITQGAGQAVPGYPAVQVTSADPTVAPYTGLVPGIVYTVTIVDDAAGLMDAASATLKPCPNTPDITLTLQCLLLDGDSLVTATVAELEDGAQYLIEVLEAPSAAGGTASSAAGAALIASAPLTGGPAPSTASFQVPNNVNYTFTVTKVGNAAVTGSATIFAAICDLPTFDLPTLALTGAGDTALPMLGALGLVQFGVALLALAAMLQFAPRRRTS